MNKKVNHHLNMRWEIKSSFQVGCWFQTPQEWPHSKTRPERELSENYSSKASFALQSFSWPSQSTLYLFMQIIFKVFIEFATTLPVFLGFFFFFVMCDLSSTTRDWTCTPCFGRGSIDHWITREVPPLPLWPGSAGVAGPPPPHPIPTLSELLRTTPKIWEMYCMLNCWLCGGQYCRNVSTSSRSSFCSSSPKCSTWFCRSSTETRQPSVSPLPSLSTRHMMRAASLCRRVEWVRPYCDHSFHIHLWSASCCLAQCRAQGNSSELDGWNFLCCEAS